jgi:hypothetical protein
MITDNRLPFQFMQEKNGHITDAPTNPYIISDQDTSGDPSYYGFVTHSGQWYIMNMNAGTGAVRYAAGDTAYVDNWTGRAGLTYDYFYNIF